jgi:hypothetical protein
MNEYQKVLDILGDCGVAQVSVKGLMAQAYAQWKNRDEAAKLLEEVISSGTASPYSIAGIYSALRENDSAFEFLDAAYQHRDLQLVSLKVDPTLDGLRSDPRLAELVVRVGIPT